MTIDGSSSGPIPNSRRVRSLADPSKERVQPVDRGPRRVGRRVARTGHRQSDPDERELALPHVHVRRDDLRQDGGESGAMRQLPPRPQGMADRMDSPDPGPARLAEAGQVRRKEQLAPRLEVRPVDDRDRQPFGDRSDDLKGDPLGERIWVARQQ